MKARDIYSTVAILSFIGGVVSQSVNDDPQVTLNVQEDHQDHQEASVLLQDQGQDVPATQIGKSSDKGEGIRRFDAEIEDKSDAKVTSNLPTDDRVKREPLSEQDTRDNDNDSRVHQTPELIPVKVDQVLQSEVNYARKSLLVDEDEPRNERSDKEKINIDEIPASDIQHWKEQAVLLQQQIKNESYLSFLRDAEILPGVPKFTEIQVLDLLKKVAPKKLDESFFDKANTSALSKEQLEALKCAEGFVKENQRKGFADDMLECIRGLNFMNCMRIFIWPIIVDNVPESITQRFPTLPLEFSLSDFLPANRETPKIVRATAGAPQQRLISPELVISNILKDALEGGNLKDYEKIPTYIDEKNETFAQILTPGQLEILQLAEKFLPESLRQDYANRMYSCVTRFEYFSCIKFFTWPMIKQNFPALPEFPDYQSWYPASMNVFPGYPLIPFPDNPSKDGELPEVIEAEFKNRRPRPETLIVHILKNTLDQQPRQQLLSSAVRLQDDNIKAMTKEQLASIQMAEQLIPIEHRAEFVNTNVDCMRQFNYLTCLRYVTWPTVRKWKPSMPHWSELFGQFAQFGIPDFISSTPSSTTITIPTYPIWFPGGGGSIGGLEGGAIGGSISAGGAGSGLGGGGASSGGNGGSNHGGAAAGSGSGGSGGSNQGGMIVGSGSGGSGSSNQGGAIAGGGNGGSSSVASGGFNQGSSGGSGGSAVNIIEGSNQGVTAQPGNGGIIIIIPGQSGGSGSSSGSSNTGSSEVSSGSNWASGSHHQISGGTTGGSSGSHWGSGGGGSGGQSGSGSSGGQGNTGGSDISGGSGTGGSGGTGGISGGSWESNHGGSTVSQGGSTSGGSGGNGGNQGGGVTIIIPPGGSGGHHHGSGIHHHGTGGSTESGNQGSHGSQWGSGNQWQSGGSWGSSGRPPGLPGISGGSGGNQGSGGGSWGSGGGPGFPGLPGISGGSGGNQGSSGGNWGSGGGSTGGSGISGGSGGNQGSGGGNWGSGGGSTGGSGISGGSGGSQGSSGGNWGSSGGSIGGSGISGGSGGNHGSSGGNWGSIGGSIGGSGISGGSGVNHGSSGGNWGSSGGSIGGSGMSGGSGSNQGSSGGNWGSSGGSIGGSGGSVDHQGSSGGNWGSSGGSIGGSGGSVDHQGSSGGNWGSSGGSISGSGVSGGSGGNQGSSGGNWGSSGGSIGGSGGSGDQGSGGGGIDISVGSSGGSHVTGGEGSISGSGGDQGSTGGNGSGGDINVGGSGDGQGSGGVSGGSEIDQGSGGGIDAGGSAGGDGGNQGGSVGECTCCPTRTTNTRDSIQYLKGIEPKIIDILHSLRYSMINSPIHRTFIADRQMMSQTRLTNEQLTILELSESMVPFSARRDLISRSLGCLQGGADFMICTKNVIWPFLQLYIENIPEFPASTEASAINNYKFQSAGEKHGLFARKSQQPITNRRISSSHGSFGLLRYPNIQIAARTPLQSGISAKSDDQPIISVTGTRFVPIYSDHPEGIILNILNAMAKSKSEAQEFSSKIANFPELLSPANQQQESILKLSESLLPENARTSFFENMLTCLRSNEFIVCSRDIMWPQLIEYYPRMPSFPAFQRILNSGAAGDHLQPIADNAAPIAETNVKTDQAGDAMITITDTQFVPISERPEEVLLKLLKSMESSTQNPSYSSIAKSPAFGTQFTKSQSDVLVTAENLLPPTFREVFIIRMSDCTRGNSFLDCMRDISWPTLGQFYSRLPSFPNIGTGVNLPAEKPQQSALLPPHVEPNYAEQVPERIEFLPLSQYQSNNFQPFGLNPYTAEYLGLQQQASTSSVGSTLTPAFAEQPKTLLDISQENTLQNLTRVRRNIDNQSNVNLTETDFIELLNKILEKNPETDSEKPFVETLNSTVKDLLTDDQLKILNMTERLGIYNTRGIMGQVINCITGLSFIRCLGIFMVPVIMNMLPSLGLGLPFGRSNSDNEDDLMKSKESIENLLLDWYKSLTQEKFSTSFGLLEFQGYGNGEIGVKLSGFRQARARIKDHKNLPSILTIISDIMEDVLDPKPENVKVKKIKRQRSLKLNSFDEANSDDRIIQMLLERLKANNTNVDGGANNEKKYLTIEDAYRAFEVLFGAKFKGRLLEEEAYQNDNFAENSAKTSTENEKKKDELVIKLPQLNENIELARKLTKTVTELSRRMKNNMMQMAPGVGLAVTFLLQVALAHARAAASVAEVISNMALGSAMFTFMRQTWFAPAQQPKVHYIHNHEPSEAGINWS
ncbi:uncharacterized protein LOC123269784 [Cotesia glomerata]|uniref:uncharacterized protein LOC123269784 n=1 Tax=Cotesia glomerata TaxID=32391 RepID=UPI001D032642|nr:uncharacterized protein LOC123269784 [Cotesia glomerata]